MARQWMPARSSGLSPAGLFIGRGTSAIEVAVARSSTQATNSVILRTWKARRQGRAAPVLLVVLNGQQALLCGASGITPPVYNVDAGQAERLCQEVLSQPDRHAALRLLSQALPSLETNLPGLNNEGFLAFHELEQGVPQREDWRDANLRARRALNDRNENLLRSLGFDIEPLDNLTSLLRSNDRRTALAVVLHDSESADTGSVRFNSLSPVSYAFKKADDEGLPWIVLTQGSRIRLYATDVNQGVGRRGRTESYIECQPWLLSQQHLGYLWLLFSATALEPEGSLRQILDGSQRFAGDLAKQLRERIYDRVVPKLAHGIAQERHTEQASMPDLALTYEMALTVLFRLLFIAYAEDRDLLPFRTNNSYRRRSITEKAKELAVAVERQTPIAGGTTHWHETAGLWQAIASGNVEWGVPAYGGALFEDDAMVSQAGAELASITLPNECFESALRHLLVIETPEGGYGPVDFRALSVREFGTIYEGLLESELARAESDLVLKNQNNGLVYVPATDNQAPVVSAGEVYLHNRSGARKSSGSYYTKSFAVGHLLDNALEPALKDHFVRLDALDDTAASEAFFDFRVADIAMGSGHFLIEAIDRIERGMADYLTTHTLPGVLSELNHLRAAGHSNLGDLGKNDPIDDSQLLRRLIARRCIYGVDLNPLAVQLARLAVWIHTFVPGLPLSFLDHNLVRGNSLVGIGTVDEVRSTFQQLSMPLFAIDEQKLVGGAEKPLRRLANLNDASLEDVADARQAAREAREALRTTKMLFDLIASRTLCDESVITDTIVQKWEHLLEDALADDPDLATVVQKARNRLYPLSPLHFPIAFPEVFLRERPGFDVILGNPPWQEATVEKHAFWARHFPGLRSGVQRQQEAEIKRLRRERPDLVLQYEAEVKEARLLRKALGGGLYPGMGIGDPDLYKAFCWRFWRLVTAKAGRIGVVLPRSALAAKGSKNFRQELLSHATRVSVDMLTNRAGWVFHTVTAQYTIGLVCLERGEPENKSVRIRGPFMNLENFAAGVERSPTMFSSGEIRAWNDSLSLPLLPNESSIEVFAQLRAAPRLDLQETGTWRARPDRELDATNQKKLMDLKSEECPEGFWPVYKGKSFNLWTPDTGTYYAWADPQPITEWLQNKRYRARNNRRSAHSEFQESFLQDMRTLPCHAPRVAFRDVARSTDARTIIACLVPPEVFIGNQAPYFLWPRGDEKDQAYLVGILSSIPLDWYARRFVELHVNFYVINPFPIPRPSRNSALWRRVVELAGRLACPDNRFADWAKSVGVRHGPLAADEKQDLIHELDAVVSHLYGLTESQVIHVFETFHASWDYGERLLNVLRHFEAWRENT